MWRSRVVFISAVLAACIIHDSLVGEAVRPLNTAATASFSANTSVISATATSAGLRLAPEAFGSSFLAGGTSTAVRERPSSDTFTWTPSVSQLDDQTDLPARHAIQVTANGATPSSDPVTRSRMSVTLTADRAAPQPPGTTVNFTAAGAGGTAPYDFKWWLFNGRWSVLRDWSTSNTLTWRLEIGSAHYHVAVWARNQGRTTDRPGAYAVMPFPTTLAAANSAGKTSVQAASVSTTELASPAATPTPAPVPALSITAPITASGVVSITASASNATALSSLDLRVDATLLKVSTTNPLTTLWDSRQIADGAHTLQARAYYSSGKGLANTSQNINIANLTSAPTTPAPTPTVSSPTPSPTAVPVPQLAEWEAQMMQYGKLHGDWLVAHRNDTPIDPPLGATFYDATRVFYQIQDYTHDPSWAAYAQAARYVYRDRYLANTNPQYGPSAYWLFTTGLRIDFERTGDPLSKTAVIAESNSGYAADTADLTWTGSTSRSREVAYAIVSFIDAEKLGAAPRSRRPQMVNQAYDHINQWFVQQTWRGLDWQFSPFMVALTAMALIRDWEQTNDARLIPALTMAADYLWTHALDSTGTCMVYNLNPASVTEGGIMNPAPDLNLIIAPMYAFLYAQTGDTKYRDQGDTLFAGGVQAAALYLPKQFNQSYEWSFEYLKWRTGSR